MTTTSANSASGRLVGLRLHSRRGPHGRPTSPVAQQLIDFEQQGRQRQADEQALRELIAASQQHLAELPVTVGARLDEVASIAVELGLSIARELVGAALDKGMVDPTPTVTRCLQDCVHGSDRGDLVVRLHPDDCEAVQQRIAASSDLDELASAARFVADANVPRGGVRAETGAGRLRYDPREVLERICDEVRREATA